MQLYTYIQSYNHTYLYGLYVLLERLHKQNTKTRWLDVVIRLWFRIVLMRIRKTDEKLQHHQPINQPINQSINPSIHPSIHPSINRPKKTNPTSILFQKNRVGLFHHLPHRWGSKVLWRFLPSHAVLFPSHSHDAKCCACLLSSAWDTQMPWLDLDDLDPSNLQRWESLESCEEVMQVLDNVHHLHLMLLVPSNWQNTRFQLSIVHHLDHESSKSNVLHQVQGLMSRS